MVKTINDFILGNLRITDAICIQRAHRLGRKQFNTGGRGQRVFHRPIIVAIRDYQDVEKILQNTKHLAGTRFGVNRDFPYEIAQARKHLFPRLKALKTENPGSKVSIQYPARLVIDN